jgi:selenocysteine lyase
MVIFGILKYFKEAKSKQKSPTAGLPHIVTTNVEHDAVILPIKHLEEEELIGPKSIFTLICKNKYLMI